MVSKISFTFAHKIILHLNKFWLKNGSVPRALEKIKTYCILFQIEKTP